MVYRSALQLLAATCTWISSCFPLLRFLQIMSASGPWESKSETHAIFSLIWFRETWKTGNHGSDLHHHHNFHRTRFLVQKSWPLSFSFLHREGLLNRILFWGDSISSLPFSCRNRPLNFRFMDRNDYNFYFDSLRSKSLSFEKIISLFPRVKFSFLLTLFISGLVVKNRWFTVWSLLPLRRLVLFCLLCSIQEMTNVSFEGWDGREKE